jgi:hypothetical protein
MTIIKRLGLVSLLVGCALVAVAVMQCGGGTSTTTGTINSADGATQGTGDPPAPSGW